MRAVVYNAREDVAITDVPEPKAGDGQVLVKVGYNGICGTDLHEYYAGPIFIPTEPHPLDQSAAAVDPRSRVLRGHHRGRRRGEGWVEGDRVAVEPIYECGPLRALPRRPLQRLPQIGFHGLCPTAEWPSTPSSTSDAAQAARQRVAGTRRARRADVGGLPRGDPRRRHPDDTAMVFGAGPIGIGLWFALRGKGLDDVFVVEPSPTRRAAIEKLGAHDARPDKPRRSRVHRRPHQGRRRRRGVRRRRRHPRGRSTALACSAGEADGQRRDLRTAAGDTASQLVMNESRIQGSLCYTGADFGPSSLDGEGQLRHHRLGRQDRPSATSSTKASRRCMPAKDESSRRPERLSS